MKEYRFMKMLAELGREDILLAGGKGANLGEMIKAGLPVPGGFVLLADAYRKFVDANDLTREIDSLIRVLDCSDEEDINSSAERIRDLFTRGEIPPDIKAELDHIYEELGEPQVAVRSSATAEDLPGASFAGQYNTFLNIRGREELYEAVKKCWASLWNERAVSYRAKQNIDSKTIAHGVVVQKMINAEKSGILFTANPVNGRRDQVSLSSSWGLGEAIVSGEVDPDQWVIDKKSGRVVSEYIAEKKVQTVRNEKGVELVQVACEKQKEVSLNEQERGELLDLALKVEGYFRFPQDIEWASENGKIYLVQTRPVTTLFPMPQPEETDDKLHVFINITLYSQGMHAPLTPLGLDLFLNVYLDVGRRINRKYYKKPALWNKCAAGRMFLDITELIKSEKVQGELVSNNMFNKDPVTIKIIMHLLEREQVALFKPKTPAHRFLWGIITKANPWFVKYVIISIPKIICGVVAPKKALDRAFKYGHRVIAGLERGREKLETRKEKLAYVEQNLPFSILFNPFQMMFYGIVSMNYLDKARELAKKHELDLLLIDKVEKSVPNCVTTEMGIAMLEAAKKIDQAGENPSPEHPEIKLLLQKYGHRAVEEIDVGTPRWREDPDYVVSLIKSYIDNRTYQQGTDKFYREMEEAEKAIKKIVTDFELRGARRDARKVEKLLRGHRELYGIREYPKFMLLKAIDLYRKVCLEIGEELQQEGRLDRKEDIFMVGLRDIESGEKLQEKVKQNRQEYEKEMSRVSVPRIMTSTGETFYAAVDDSSDDGFRGIPVSPGYCEGQVKVLKHPGEAVKLNQGDIMVTAATNPSWTPLFMIIGGLIMETGGPISHGSVVAREYGIPAVVGVKDAMARFEDGQKVRINGETGSVELINV